MSEQTEHRGWEIENSYHQHVLDDAEWDIASDSEGASGVVWGVALLLTALVVGSYLLGKWAEPPVVTFPPPAPPNVLTNVSVPVFLPALPPGWGANCIFMDGKAKVLRPNWENPNCKGPR